MLKAVLQKGAIVPLDPLPPEWEDGQELTIEKAAAASVDIDAWAAAMNQLCADSIIEQEQTMRRAIEDHRRQAKAQVHREMGLSA